MSFSTLQRIAFSIGWLQAPFDELQQLGRRSNCGNAILLRRLLRGEAGCAFRSALLIAVQEISLRLRRECPKGLINRQRKFEIVKNRLSVPRDTHSGCRIDC